MKFHIFHEWSNWEKIGEGRRLNYSGTVLGYYIIQQRTCFVCGYMQRKQKDY